jgi:hypothetical protein
VANHLFEAGHGVSIADYLVPVPMDGPGNPGSVGGDVVVAHSGAGVLVPNLLADQRPARSKVVLVDAAMPPLAGEMPVVPPAFLDHLRSLAGPLGMLPPWSTWFGSDVLAELVPDAERREAVREELPLLPLAYFEASVTIPPNWADFDGGYLLLSEIYRPDAEAAAARGWPVLERLGGHLDLVTRPEVVAEAIVTLATL